LTAALLVAGALGCGSSPSPQSKTDAGEDKSGRKDQAAVPKKDPKQDPKPEQKKDPKPRTGPPAEMMIGKWESAEHERGFEFCADGTIKLSLHQRLPITGKYKLLDADTIEWQFPENEKPFRHKFAVTPTAVTFTTTDKQPRQVVYKAVDVYSQDFNHPNRRPNDRQRQWLVGSWRGVENRPGSEDVYLYTFHADGTFSLLINKVFLRKTSLEQGTYRVHPDADNFLELSYPDTGKTEAVYAEIGEKELALVAFWGFGKELRKHQRAEDKEERIKPVRADVLTAFALFRECAAAPEKSKEKYAGKSIEVTGPIAGHLTINDKSEIHLLTGKGAHLRCLLDTKDKATAAALQKLQFGLFDDKVRFVTISGKFDGIVKEEDKAAKIIAGTVGGEPVEKGPQLFVRLSECRVVGSSELRLK
jgi:hypothetical protein